MAPEADAVGLFLSSEYLRPLEESGCVAPATGWTRLALPAPCYEKTHSWGEFVFDHAFARAYEQRGLDYYPKLVCCVPFTPVPGARLLAADDAGRRALAGCLLQEVQERGCSSAHVLYLPESEAQLLASLHWLRREQERFVWRNPGYARFEDFLGRLNSKRRRNIRRERKAVADSGLVIEWRAGAQLSAEEWRAVFALYARTYRLHGQRPYLNLACLRAWAENFPEQMLFCLAREGGELAAMAFYFRDGDSLYGRHWGARADHDGLHFELCCHQGIEYCIAHGLRRFDAGVQGEHKLLRGFEPELSLSMHWFAHAGFREAIADYLGRESRALQREVDQLAEHDGYRRGSAD